ncbi:MAG: toxin-antitoxin system YwqK family antitoxin [Clostridium sp.]|uniref:toxin-antitoxin system YwqK family antitoxin n=1 Tax=Clostridium sp. TaxID=1506 RepID=UPI003F38B976
MKSVKKILVGLAILSLMIVAYGCGNSNKDGYDFQSQEESVQELEKNYRRLKPYYVVMNKSDVDGKYKGYKITSEKSYTMYYGEVKDNKPNGEGIIFINGTLIYAGSFKDGAYDGFGIEYGNYKAIDEAMTKYKIVYKSYAGYFKEGKRNGKGNVYIPEKYSFNKYQEEENNFIKDNKEKLEASINKENFTSLDVPMVSVKLEASGEMKDNELDGHAKTYYENGNIKTDGEYVKGRMEGEGKIYYENGKIKYEGGICEDKYNGRGKLYSENGSLIFKGVFKNEAIA